MGRPNERRRVEGLSRDVWQPIDKELVLDITLLALNPRDDDDISKLFILTRESIVKSALEAYHDQKQATSKFVLSAVIVSEPVLGIVRRVLRRMSPDVRVELEDIRTAIEQDVFKREVIEGEQAEQARKRLQRAENRMLRVKKQEAEDAGVGPAQPAEIASPPIVQGKQP